MGLNFAHETPSHPALESSIHVPLWLSERDAPPNDIGTEAQAQA